ncbi:MAG: LemA family protein [Candidatus Margulisiibacteriota bacterium]|jgi:LemA protein
MILWLVLILVVFLVYPMFIYNQLIRNKQLLKEAWSGIDVQLKRRHDLIPVIVESVKGYVQHEKGVLEDVVRLRNKIEQVPTEKEKLATENQLSQALKSLFAVAEGYPDLKANQNFLALQTTLADIEDQMQMARRYYNGTARDLNIVIGSFPSSLVASWFNYLPAEYFEVDYATERQMPDVKF